MITARSLNQSDCLNYQRLERWRPPALIHLICLTILMVCLAGQAPGQTGTGSIAGAVRDPSGAVVPGATVTAIQVATNLSRTTTTNSTGYYHFPFLPPATYRIEAVMTGFEKFVRENVQIDVGLAATVDVDLHVGATTQSLTVTTSLPLLQTSTSSLGEVVSNTQITELPINGRNSFGFAALVPGVRAPYGFTQVAYGMYNDQFVSINGARPNQNTFIMDGGHVAEPGFNGPGIFPPMDSVQEYKVQTNNHSAEFSNAAGGVVNVVTKGGTNQYHGDIYEFLRNNALDANDFFLNSAGQPIPPYRFNQFGGTIGGPLSIPHLYDGKDRTFFFVSYEGLRWDRSLNALGTMPTLAQRAGDFSDTYSSSGQLVTIYNPFSTDFFRTPFPGNKIPQALIDPVAANLVNWVPLPNIPGNPTTGVNNFSSSYASTVDKDTGLFRIDQAVTQNQRLSFTFVINNTPVTRPSIFGPQLAASSPTYGDDQLNERYAVLHYVNPLRPDLVMELTSSFIRYSLLRRGPGNNFDPTQLGFPSYLKQLQPALQPCFPNITVEGMGATIGIPDNGLSGGFIGGCLYGRNSVQDLANIANFTYVKGAHTFKFGGEFGSNVFNSEIYNMAYQFLVFGPLFTEGPNPFVASPTAGSGFASFLTGAALGGQVLSGGTGQDLLYDYWGLYFQDDWKATRKLSLNLGIRYDYQKPWTDRWNHLSDFNFTAPSPLQVPGLNLVGGLEFPGVNGLPRGQFNGDWTHLAPRFGLAYELNDSTVVRGGFGLFTAPIQNGGTATTPNSGFVQWTPWISTLDYIHPLNLLSNPYPYGFLSASGSSLGLATLLGQSVVGMPRTRPTPYAMAWNFGIERILPGNSVLHLAYAGSRGIHLSGDMNYNQLPDKYLSMGSALSNLVPNPFYGKISGSSLSGSTVVASQLLLPYPQFTGVTSGQDAFGASGYHSLELNVEHRFSNGFALQAAYTYSKTMDNVSPSEAGFPGGEFSTFQIQDWNNRSGSWAPAVWDTPHNLMLNGLYHLPFGPKRRFLNSGGPFGKVVGGWQLGGILTLQSGVPLALTTATDTLNNYSGTQFPNFDGTSPYIGGSASSKVNEWFNPNAFSIPAPYTYGNTARTLSWLRGPAQANLDLALDKDTTISERVTLQFRFEAFNSLNHPWFGLPNTTIGSPAAGVISDQENFPRQIQFALKLLF